MKKIYAYLFALLTFGSVALPAFAFAQTSLYGNTNTGVNTTVSTGSTSVGVSATTNTSASASLGTKGTVAIQRADKEIDRRNTALTDLLTRVQGMVRVTESFKTSINSAVQAQITALTALKAKIDADTDAATLKADVQSVTQAYRIFALVMPQVRIAAAADRVVSIASMMNALGAKLQARITAAGSTGHDVTALTTVMADFSAKLSDAQKQAQAAINISAPLQPDNGDKTVMASNLVALKQARKDIQAAQQDFVAARKDIETVLQGLHAFSVNASSTASTTVHSFLLPF